MRAMDCVKQTMVEDQLDAICASFGPYAEDWGKDKLKVSLVAISNWALLRDNRVISMEKGRKIAKSARQLLNELDGVHGLDAEFMRILHALEAMALGKPDWRGRGDDRRSGQQTRDNQALGMIVQLFFQARANPGFSKGGPFTRFVRDVCALLGIEHISDEAIRGELYRLPRKTTSVEKSEARVSSRRCSNQILK